MYSIEYTFCVTVLNPIFVIEKKAVNDVITIQSLYKDLPQQLIYNGTNNI
jgi:hypothetical protein